MQQIETIFSDSGLKHDRFFNESFQLPYDFNAIKIESNDLCTYRVINDSINKLYDNFLYIYGLTKMASNAVPLALSGILASTGNDPKWNDISLDLTTIEALSSHSSYKGMDNTKLFSVTYSDVYNKYLMASCIDNRLLLSIFCEDKTESDEFIVLINTNLADSITEMPFANIRGVKFCDNDLFVLDTFYNNLYKYSLKGLITDDVFQSSLHPEIVIGGYGIFQDKYKFNQPTSFCIVNNNIFVLDAGNFCIKKYDTNLNNIDVYQYKSLFATDRPVYIEGDPASGKVFVVTEGLLMYVFNNDFKSYTTVDISIFISDIADFKNIFVSKAYANCLYLTTTTDIFKVYISKPQDQIGRFSIYRFGVDAPVFLTAESVASKVNPGYDNIYVFSTKNEITFCVHSIDSENYADVLTLRDFSIFTKEEIFINKHEYTQTWVYNKALSKLMLNHLRLKDKIKGRFTGIYDERSNPLFTGTLYFLMADLDLTSYRLTLDHFIGNNEVLSSAVINRCLQKIYNLQQSIISKSNTTIQDSSFFESSSVNIG